MRRHIRSERVKLPRVHRVTRNGVVYKYHRATRAELPRDVPEDHPTFLNAWSTEEARGAAERSDPKAPAGTIAAGCQSYLASRSYLDLSDGYRALVRRHVDAINKRAGQAKMAHLLPRHVETDIEPLTPAVASHRLKAWRKLSGYWKKRGWVESDFAQAATGKPIPKTEGHREWTIEDVAAFRTRWPEGTPQRFAFELLQWTGARASDVVRLGPGMIKRGMLTFRQQKTKGEVFVPWSFAPAGLETDHAALMAVMPNVSHMVFLVTVSGKARSHKAFSSWFADAARAAALDGLSAHGLRKYRLNALAEAGKSVLQMQAWCGHATLSEIEHYTRRAQRRTAFQKEQKVKPVKPS
ncbi:site-specific tyrosine recombinase XerD [Roseivivax sp. THAF40]|uniref:tyrosine-type recombinase/integrase n=1 Tax=Roseivivax sp. THAF40 TaxID=2587858 RepID=UPI00126935A6|nr:tyrosine-type recombinase/integrase [Roseivivax sp. THAF40]QFT47840.1 site-specific tyrosine recombinase XerD [Roseivivax sp. THAF40]